ncbi:hypothetical protein FNW02_37555 [Komarekiella sp. 'clone 1']|uniref:Uncharacterized protein n=1 Tax=Komarekiella delphini-convector SJRDD-AB1 TaxID=2593771 RepID=A0AA41BAK5_9NOST|nr:hypothetical protein [Komarekiella delphini-convector]MBD6621248.1 hypothetical protein [Komarekiella delphini-convector SJRDD-AB1]
MNTLAKPKKDVADDNKDLSTHHNSREDLEALVFNKLYSGEDPTQAIAFLSYLKNTELEKEQHKQLRQEAQEKSIFSSLQRVMITAFAILGMIAFFDRVFNAQELSKAGATPPVVNNQPRVTH